MHSNGDSAPRFEKKLRPFRTFAVSEVKRLTDVSGPTGEAVVRGKLEGREVEIRYVETSGEFYAESEDGRELSLTDLRDLGAAVSQFQKSVPWVDSITGSVLLGVNEATFPTALEHYRLRSVSDLGRVVLVTGSTPKEDVDVVLDTVTGELSLLLARANNGTRRRAISSQEAWDLARALGDVLEGRRATRTTVLLALVVAAARRRSGH